MTEFVPCALVFVVSAQQRRPVIPYRSKRWAGSVLEFCYSTDSRCVGTVWSLHSRLNGRHPSLAELIGLFQMSQHTSKFRVHALLTDPMALPKPQNPDVILRHSCSVATVVNFRLNTSMFY